MKYFAIFDKDVTQTIYENYLGILGVMEVKVASQPREIWVIPLIEKEYSQKNIGIWARMKMTGFREGFGNDKPL